MRSRIFLIGFMASGKTTFGKKIASRLGYTFIDLDSLVEHRTGASIPELFEQQGETGFRKAEQAALGAVLKQEKIVVATGGGTPCFFDNMQQINANGYSVYLQLSADALAARLATAKTPRPLIAGLSSAALTKFVEEKLAEREQYYSQAALAFPAHRERIPELADILQQEG